MDALCIVASQKPEYSRISSKLTIMPIARTSEQDRATIGRRFAGRRFAARWALTRRRSRKAEG
jgi:hypothetical protein